MDTCKSCRYYVTVGEVDTAGSCYGNPPAAMMVPTMPDKRAQLQGQGAALGFVAVRPQVQAADVSCKLFRPR